MPAEPQTEKTLLQKLAEPFPGDVVKWRAQGKPFQRSGVWCARVVCYIDARIVIDRLNEVCGLNWQKKTTETAKGRVLCSIGITLENGREVWRDDGAGDTDIEGEKGAISDALKRAAVNFGVGAYLYGFHSPVVEVEVSEYNGKTNVKGITKAARDKLAKLANKSLEDWDKDLRAMEVKEDEAAPQDKPKPRAQETKPAAASQAKDEGAAPAPRESVQTPSNVFPAPANDTPIDWQAWSRGPMSVAKNCATLEEGLSMIKANAKQFEAFKKATNKDGLAHVMSLIEKRFPDREGTSARTMLDAVRGGRAEEAFQDNSADVIIKAPKVESKATMAEWAGKLRASVIEHAQTEAEVETWIAANLDTLKRANALFEQDIGQKVRNEWAKAQAGAPTR